MVFSRRSQAKPFVTIEEVKKYFDADKLDCLLCGRQYVSLGCHLQGKHAISADDYKLRFGIPLSYGLAGKAFREQSARRMKRLKKTGRIRYKPTRATIRKMLLARASRRPLSAATLEENRQKLLRFLGMSRTWQAEDFEEFVRRCESGRTPQEVQADEDMPSRDSLRQYLKRNPRLKRRYDRMWERLPFVVQARANKTGERYRRTLVQLRLSGNSWKEISRHMGVSKTAIRTMWFSLKRGRRIKKYC
jgi:ROS/MUCR transcriptional regulator protein